MATVTEARELLAYRDPNHPGNRIRPRVKCLGCGQRGCVTYWGPWCFACNVERIDRISGKLDRLTPTATPES